MPLELNSPVPEERKINNLMASQVIRKDTESGAYIVDTRSPSAMLDADDIDRFNAAFGLAGARDRHLVSEVAKMEASLVRHAIGLRRLLLRYVKALLMFILTALVSFTIAALLLHATDPASINTASDRAPINILIVSVGYLVWAPLTVVIVMTPVKWIYKISSADAENIVQRDPQLVEFEKKVLWLAWVAGIAALCAAATLF